MITPVLAVLAVQHKLHNKTHDGCVSSRAERGQALLRPDSIEQSFHKGQLRESRSRDGGISLRRVGPPVLSQSRSAYR
jgi:hypothetical protein